MKKEQKTNIALFLLIFAILGVGYYLYSAYSGQEVDTPNEQEETIPEDERVNKNIDESTTLEEAEDIAENWIKEHSPTYKGRGGYNLELTNSKELGLDGWYEITFSFTTEYPGYNGKSVEDAEAQGLEKQETDHEMVVTMQRDYIEAAIIDKEYDDSTNQSAEERDFSYDEIEERVLGARKKESFERAEELTGQPIDETITLEEAKEIARDGIKFYSATYRDRNGDNLELTNSKELDIEGWYEFTFSFTTEYPGYGPLEEGQSLDDLEKQEAEHEIVVTMERNHVKAAIVDGEYDDSTLLFSDGFNYERIAMQMEEGENSIDNQPLDESTTLEEAEQIATRWMEYNSSTYNERGGFDLELIEKKSREFTEELGDGYYGVTLNFKTQIPGYGPLEDSKDIRKLEKKIVEHEIEFTMHYNKIELAVIDEEFNDHSLETLEEMNIDPEENRI